MPGEGRPFQPGNKIATGRPKGSKDTKPRAPRVSKVGNGEALVTGEPQRRRLLITSTSDVVQRAASAHLAEALEVAGQAAKNDPRAAIDFAKLVSPPPSRLIILPENVRNAPPDIRVGLLVELASSGKIDIQQCEALVRLAEREYNALVVRHVRDHLILINQANGEGNRERVVDLVVKLAEKVTALSARIVSEETNG